MLKDTRSAIQFHAETFGRKAIDLEEGFLEAFVAEAEILPGKALDEPVRPSHLLGGS